MSFKTYSPELASAFEASDEAIQQLLDQLKASAPHPPKDPAQLEPLYAMGFSALQAGQSETAYAVFMVLVSQAPLEARFYAGLSLAQKARKETEAAYLSMVLAHHLDKGNLKYPLAAAELLMALDQRAPARLALMGVVALSHNTADKPLHDRAQALLELYSHAG
ncbi:MAG: hypothetical protein RI949_2110 [Pseudomonadota bacterium]|jgi:Flp pilus assembly protein TadD